MSLDFKQMALTAELSWLRRQQRKAMEDATFLGWDHEDSSNLANVAIALRFCDWS
jgi:hypothetical protein